MVIRAKVDYIDDVKKFKDGKKKQNFIVDIQVFTSALKIFFEKWGYLLASPGIYI